MKKKETAVYLFIFIVSFFYYVNAWGSLERKVPEGPVDIEADNISYDSEKELYRASGNVLITFSGGYLKADSVLLYKVTKEALAEGHVIIESDRDILTGDSIQFNLDTKEGRVKDGTLFISENHFYLRGKEIKKTGESTYSLKEARATTCDGDRPDWQFKGSEVDVTIDGYGTLKNGTFQINNIPVLYLPYMVFPAKTTRQTGLLYPRISYSSEKMGWDLGIPFYWAISENTDATFYQRYMDKRGFQEGIEFRYYINENSLGTFYTDFLDDSLRNGFEDDSMVRDWREDQKRWSYYWNHETTFSPGFYLRTDMVKVSDNWYFEDFDSSNYYLDNYAEGVEKRFKKISFEGNKSLASLESKARLVKDWNLFNLTALVQYTDNFQSYSNDTTLQRYPEIAFSAINQPLLDSPVHFEMESYYDYYYRTTGYRGHYLDLYPIFSLPMRYGDYFEFTPSLGLRETKWDSVYSEADGAVPQEGKRGSREYYSFGGTVSSEVQRIFDIGGERIDKIRHGVRPEITYSYIPYVYQDDSADFVGFVNEANIATYTLTNTFTSRLKDDEGNISYREFFNLKLSQSYNIKEARRNLAGSTTKRRPFGNVIIDGTVDPFRYLTFDADAEYNVNSGEWMMTNYALTANDWRGDAMTAEYRYTKRSVEEINIALKAKLTEALSATYVFRRNELDNKYLETVYGFNYQSQCWGVEATYSDTSDDRRYMLVFSLYGIGKVGRVSKESVRTWSTGNE
ncbi:MAG: LPS-assembly protein LptD [Deltaproteobacteria bacterium]|nr:LPS-assembly protein LptD [Deltaproteobacteria bacterium]